MNTRAEGTAVTGQIGCSDHPMIEHFKFLAARTSRTPKITIPSPSAIYGRPVELPIDRKIYPTNETMFADLGKAYAKAVRGFADAGCRYLQLDEVFIAMLCDDKYRQQMRDRGDDPDKLGVLYGDLINAAMSDIPADMTITMHLCRGNYRSTWQGQGGYEKVQEVLFNRIGVHGYFMEYDTERAGGFEPLAMLPKGKQVVLGIMTTKSGQLESKDQLKRRIDEAAKFVDLDQVCISGQCGFASTEEGNSLSARTSSGRSWRGWWRWRGRCGVDASVGSGSSAARKSRSANPRNEIHAGGCHRSESAQLFFGNSGPGDRRSHLPTLHTAGERSSEGNAFRGRNGRHNSHAARRVGASRSDCSGARWGNRDHGGLRSGR